MNDFNSTPKGRAKFTNGIVHLSILLLGALGAAGLIYTFQPPKPKPTQAIYSIYLIQSETPIADFQNEARDVLAGIRPMAPLNSTWSMQGNMRMMATFGTTGNFSVQIPDSSNGTMRLEQVTIDLTASAAKKGVRTKFGFLKGAVRSEHQFELGKGDLRVIELSKGNAPVHGYYYALAQVEAIDPTPPSNALGIPRTITVPSTGMSK